MRVVGRDEIGLLPGKAVAARVETVRPHVRSPGEPRSNAAAVVQVASYRINAAATHLLHLGFDDPLYGEAGFIRVWLWIEVARCVARVDPAREEYLLQVGIAHFRGAYNVSQ